MVGLRSSSFFVSDSRATSTFWERSAGCWLKVNCVWVKNLESSSFSFSFSSSMKDASVAAAVDLERRGMMLTKDKVHQINSYGSIVFENHTHHIIFFSLRARRAGIFILPAQ